jgi:phosphoglycolate phosphatase-like HAD superfamily hydrolase
LGILGEEKIMVSENIALFDMDGTLCDYEKGLKKSLDALKSPDEPFYEPEMLRTKNIKGESRFNYAPSYLKARADLVQSWRGTKFWCSYCIWRICRYREYCGK